MENQNPPPPPFPPNNPQGNPYQQNPYQQNPYQQNPQMPFGAGQRELPNATAILVLGIVSIVTAFCYGVVGIGCGIAALIMGNKAVKDYEANPSYFTPSSYSNAKAGRICGIVGICLGALILLLIILEFIFFGSIISSMAHLRHY